MVLTKGKKSIIMNKSDEEERRIWDSHREPSEKKHLTVKDGRAQIRLNHLGARGRVFRHPSCRRMTEQGM